ncbi:MAG: hypothetical protein ACO1Q7_06945 [Gemmatimonas sp.]
MPRSFPSFTFRSAITRTAVALVATMLTAQSSHAQGPFTGTWTISEWKVAPWVKPAERAGIKPNRDILNKSLTFAAGAVTGPKLLSCAKTKYQMIDSPYEGLFEGGLPQPAQDGAALGFKTPVKTIRPSCDFDFHMRDANAVMFALDNVLYTMTKQAPVAR